MDAPEFHHSFSRGHIDIVQPEGLGAEKGRITGYINDAHSVLRPASGRCGQEKWQETRGKGVRGQIIDLPLCLKAVDCELVGNCHDLERAL